MIWQLQEINTALLRYRYLHNSIITKTISKIIYSLCKVVIRVGMPLYYKYSKSEKSGIANEINNALPPIIISLTSFPARINTIWIVIETLMRQSLKPNRIILWLATEQFPNGLSELPAKVISLQKRGLEIRFCDDLLSHKKYYYTMLENPDSIVITADDDIFYSENMVSLLVKQYQKYPNCVIANRAHKITFIGNEVAPYSKWIKFALGEGNPSMLLAPTTGGGCLFPPHVFHKEVFNKDAIRKLAPLADDIWLKCMLVLNGVKVVKSKPILSEIITLKGASRTGLAKQNVDNKLNDTQLMKVMESYNIDFSNYMDK
ncbi:hypothetical protein SDC9_14634 [bioreactor metagenome]|uniref:Glycosyltransferase 2-like domain-containing protein n=1 Tax=bioreactor metagenome TaxID=1076179 RepID=A0A644TT91_9ZZZZ